MAEDSLRLEWMDPAELADNPAQWRTHPTEQLDTFRDILSEVGWAGALLLNERTGYLIDGHGRKEVTSATGEKVPVLVGTWTEEEEEKILATLDPLGAMAGANRDKLGELLSEIETDSEAITKLLAKSQQEFAEGIADVIDGESLNEAGPLNEEADRIFHCPKCGFEFSARS